MQEPILRIPYPRPSKPALDDLAGEGDPTSPLVTREWLVSNGLGGYASGTVAGIATRRFHGLLIAALPAPLGRTLTLAHAGETIRVGNERSEGAAHGVQLGAQPGPAGDGAALQLAILTEFRLECGLPVWRYDALGTVVERRLWMSHEQNTVYVRFEVISGAQAVRLEIEPWIRFRPHDGALDAPLDSPYALTVVDDRYEVATDGYPPLRMWVDGPSSAFTIDRKRMRDVRYHAERTRGYDSTGELYSPGFFRIPIGVGASATLMASTEAWDVMQALGADRALAAERQRRRKLLRAADPVLQDGLGAHLVLAADQFVITPAGRKEDAARAHAAGDEVRTVIAGYHWFTDWGRDTMISLEGLTLATGRVAEAGFLLRTFADYVADGLIPNMFPERGKRGLYHTADATLWFFHALDRYLDVSHDDETLRLLLPKLVDIVEKHIEGTRFSIRVDARDGLLSQGQDGYALTWMDAKVGDLVVTPRRGKAVEINALWYNALRLLSGWLERERGSAAAERYIKLSDQCRDSFNRRFWYEEGGYLLDLVDRTDGTSGADGTDDKAFRPNQIFAISLPNPVLHRARWSRVVDAVKARLVTPLGLRSLAEGDADFKPKYFGDLRARDLAYHQGTVWGWLIGPFVDAWLKVDGDRESARALLKGFEAHLIEAGIGSVSEIFDAEAPFTPRGCVAQAWSVAEVLRCLVKTAG